MNRAFSTFTLFPLLVSMMAGCLAPDSSDELPIRWGLGLTLPSQLPPPGPFREGTENTTALLQAMNRTIAQVLRDCHAEDPARASEEAWNIMASGRVYGGIRVAINACSNRSEQARLLTEATRRNGTEWQVYSQLRQKAREAMAEMEDLLSRLPPPGSMADAQLLRSMMIRHTNLREFLGTADSLFEGYNKSRNPLNLESAFLNVLNPINGKDPTIFFLARWPWSSGICNPPDLARLVAWMDSEIEWILAEALRVEPPPKDAPLEDIPITEIYGAVLKSIEPAFRYYASLGWWPGMLADVHLLTWYRGVLETHAHNHLPTREEARYLVAVHQSRNRSWDTETQIQALQGRIDGPASWEAHEPEARQALALSKMRSGFSDLRCTGVHEMSKGAAR